VLVAAVSTAAFSQALRLVRRRGTISLVGLPPGESATPVFDVVLKRITLRGSNAAAGTDRRRLCAAGGGDRGWSRGAGNGEGQVPNARAFSRFDACLENRNAAGHCAVTPAQAGRTI
jgi:hypothetical protein